MRENTDQKNPNMDFTKYTWISYWKSASWNINSKATTERSLQHK